MLAFVVLSGVWLALTTFSSSHQLASAQEEFLDAIEDQDWETLEEIIHEDYADQWGHDKAKTIALLKSFRRYFLSLSLEMDLTTTSEMDGAGGAEVIGDVTVNGMGGASAQVRNHLGNIETPFVFKWKKTSSWPWSWKLLGVRNEDLEIPRNFKARINL